jgi:hypothetical protein
MATMTSYPIIKQMVDNNGVYPGDPQVLAIYEYTGGGGICWCVILVPIDETNMYASPYVHNPRLLWSKEQGKVADPTEPKEDECSSSPV